MAYLPYHFVGEVLLHPVYCSISTEVLGNSVEYFYGNLLVYSPAKYVLGFPLRLFFLLRFLCDTKLQFFCGDLFLRFWVIWKDQFMSFLNSLMIAPWCSKIERCLFFESSNAVPSRRSDWGTILPLDVNFTLEESILCTSCNGATLMYMQLMWAFLSSLFM